MRSIYKQIGPGERIALSKLAVEHLEDTGRPLRIAIDISIWQFQIQSGQGGKNPALRTLYYRLLRLLALSIQPLFVFDGPHRPPFKRGKRIVPGAAFLPDFLTKELLKRFGFPYHIAPGEAEAECALFQKEGLVDAVMSEDVDTLMFGCTVSLRNWTAEGARGNKSPTHVNVYKAEKTKENAGLDGEGMILVALMSGGDYVQAGVPGCGPKTACEAAKAGFGQDLCRIPKGDVACLKEWRERLCHELQTNESDHFRQRHRAIKLPESFPDMTVLGYYKNPAVSSKERILKLRNEITWSSTVKVSELRSFCADAFEWSYLSGAKKFIRGLAPALLAHQLTGRSPMNDSADEALKAKESAEALIVKAVCDRRSHWNTDGMPELRVAYVPNDIVRIDLDAEERDHLLVQDGSEEEQPGSGDDNAGDRSRSPTKNRGPSTYDPTDVEKIWVMETYVKLGVPLMVETWEEDMRDPKKFASRNARVKKTLTKTKAAITQPGAMDDYFKTAKPGTKRIQDKERSTHHLRGDHLPPVYLAPTNARPIQSPQKKALAENRRPLGQKGKSKDDETSTQRKPRTKTRPPASKTSSPLVKDIAANPWTLSKRPSDTIGFRSPTRYSALGIYAPADPEYLDKLPDTTDLNNKKQPSLASPPASPTPRKRRSRPTSPVCDAEPSSKTPPVEALTTRGTSRNSAGLITPRTRDHTKPSPRKKRSPLEQANDLYLSGQLRTPISLRKETLLDTFVTKEPEPLTAKKVNRKLDFAKARNSDRVASPASDTSELPSPSAMISPRPIERLELEAGGEDKANEATQSPAREDKARRLVALRESLEGAWKHLEPWESATRAAKSVYSSVEVVDLTGG